MKLNKLTEEEKRVIIDKGIEAPYCVNSISMKFIPGKFRFGSYL